MATGINANAAGEGTSSRKADKKTWWKIGKIGAVIALSIGAIQFGYWAYGNDPDQPVSVTERGPSSTDDVLISSKRVYVPAVGCSDPVPNTNTREWIDPKPENPENPFPEMHIRTPESGRNWFHFWNGARYSHIRFCGNGHAMWMVVDRYRGTL